MADAGSSEDQDKEIPNLGNLQQFTQQTLRVLVGGIQKANSLPEPGEDHDFYYSFSDFREFRKAQGTRLLNNVHDLTKQFQVRCRWPNKNTSSTSIDIDDLYESLVDANDTLLEEVDTNLDEASGLSKNRKPILSPAIRQGGPMVSSWNRKSKVNNNKEGNFRLLLAKNVQRPQIRFKDKIDNSNTPFIPIIKYKCNALKPLQQMSNQHAENPEDLSVPSVIADFIHQQRVSTASHELVNRIVHPYEYELQMFEPTALQLQEEKEKLYASLADTPYTFVETVEQLEELSQKLTEVTEFAVDLEHHSYRSFLGFVCLMQISTRDHDYLIDTLELRSELQMLNESFTNPKILKVLHGADMDIGWLQRDLGIYVVNMFDTGQASRVLAYERLSLAYLLKRFCSVNADKQYQLADWRIRPLPEEMVRYAREDTHYLLYIYDRLRNELIRGGNENNNLLKSVYQRSVDICRKHYEKPLFTSESYMVLYRKQRRPLNPIQLRAFRSLYAWRDTIARQEDESNGYVLPNHMMFNIAETLPREPTGVLACCNPVPPLVKQYVNEIHTMILEARDTSATQTEQVGTPTKDTTDGLQVEASTSVPTPRGPDRLTSRSLSNGEADIKSAPFEGHVITGPEIQVVKPVINLFDYPKNEVDETNGQKRAKKISASFINPFHVVLPIETPPTTSVGDTERTQPQADVAKINRQWKQATDQAMDESEKKESQEQTKVTAGKRQRSSDSSDSEPEDSTPLRQKVGDGKKKRKRKKKKTGTEDQHAPITVSDDDDEKASYDAITQNTPEFVPFDYNPAEYNKLAGNQETKQDKAIFNPYERSRSEKTRGAPRSKIHMKSGQRSMTYSKKRDSSKKQQWPSR